MFDGSFKATRKVNMSGRRTPYATSSSSSSSMMSAAGATTKEQILAQARLAREERQAQKRRTAASTKIQALHRRIATATRARTAAFCALESELTQLIATVDIKTTALPARSLTAYLRQFWFAFGRDLYANTGSRTQSAASSETTMWRGMAGVTRERVQNVQTYLVVMLLVSCLRGATPDTNFLTATKDATWVYQVTRLLEVALWTLTTTRFGTALEKAASPYVLLIDTLTSASKYPAVAAASSSDNDNNDNTPTHVSVLLTTLAVHAQYGTFAALGDVIRDHALAHTSAQDVANDRVVQVVSAAVVATLQLDSSRVTRAFARTILLTPGSVSSTVGRSVLAQLTPESGEREKTQASAVFWQRVLQRFELETTPLAWHERATALGNTLDLLQLHTFERALVHTACAVLPQLISDSVVQWAFDIKPSASAGESSDVKMVDVTATVTAISSSPIAALGGASLDTSDTEMRAGVQLLGAFAPSVRAQIEQLCDSTFSRRWLDAIAASLDASASVDALTGFCATYATLLLGADRSYVLSVTSSFAPPARPVFAFLSGVVVDQGAASTLDRIWMRLERALSAERSKYTGATTTGAAVMYPRAHLNMLVVFNAVYSQVLLGLDDETFYDRSWPLQLPHVEAVVACLKTFIYDTCWNVASGSSSAHHHAATDSTLFAAVTTSVKLFNQLYDRDCRRRFTADGAWLWPAMPAIKETVDLESMEDDDADSDGAGTSGGVHALHALLGGVAANSPHTRAALVLATIPQVFAFTDRVLLFEKLLDADKAQLAHLRSEFAGALPVRIKRDVIVDESFDFFQHVCETKSPSVLKAKIKVTFVNAQGLEEAGIDGGGVFKEYVDALTKRAFSPEFGSFLATSEQLLYPNPAARFLEDSAKQVHDRFRFLGLVLAKAVYENILVEPQFAAFFLNKLLGKFNYIDDLRSLDPALYRHLMQLKHYDDNVEDLALTFSVTESEYGQVVTRNLIPDGANVAVTNANRIRYIHVLANYKLNVLSSSESAAFLRGFRALIPAKWIQMFAPSELQMLIGGSANTINVDDWERHTAYGGGYHPSQQPVQWFWDIVRHDFDLADRAALLKFITSCSRQPLLGFAQLAPQICIHQVRTSDDERLPSSATCMNLLKLPTYSNKDIMRRKLLYAIKANAGFDLS